MERKGLALFMRQGCHTQLRMGLDFFLASRPMLWNSNTIDVLSQFQGGAVEVP
jgi:hypothetical protein